MKNFYIFLQLFLLAMTENNFSSKYIIDFIDIANFQRFTEKCLKLRKIIDQIIKLFNYIRG